MNVSLSDVRAGQIGREGIYRILVCRPNHRLGNALLLTPLIAELERLYKGAEIDIVAEGPAAAEIFASFFSVNHVYCLPKRGFKHPLVFLSMLRQIRQTRYDLIVDPCVGSGFGRALTRLLRGRRKIGFSDTPARPGLTHAVPLAASPRHMARRGVSLVRWLTPLAAHESAGFPVLDIRLTELERAHGRAVIRELLAASSQPRGAVVVGVFANATGAKCYTKAWWNELVAELNTLCPQASVVEIVPMHGHSMLDAHWPGYYSTSLRRMGAVMSAVDVMISADCGVMHLAVASQVPTVGLFCVTDDAVYGPCGAGNGSLRTRGQSAAETAERIVGNFPGLLRPLADLPAPSAAPASTSLCQWPCVFILATAS